MTSPFNPYQPPEADELESNARVTDSSPRLASLTQRFLASLIDSVLGVALVAPLQYKFGVFARLSAKTSLGLGELVLWAAVYFGFWLVENGYFLVRNSQTIGKRLLGIRIESIAGGRASLSKIVFLRTLPFSCIANIPAVGGAMILADTLLIFRKDRRCLHDHFAGTQVVKVR